MNPEVTKAMLEYEQLKLNEKIIKARCDELMEVILPAVEVGKKYDATEGSFEVKSRANWKFGPRVEQKMEEVKALQEEEKAKGIAVNNPTVYVEYRVKKN